MDSSCGFVALSLETSVLGHRAVIHPSLFWNDDEAVLVDSGYPGKGAELYAAVSSHPGSRGKPFSIVITHQDIDHIGGGEEFIALMAKDDPGREIVVFAHGLDAPYIRGDLRLIKFAGMGGFSPSIPEGVPEEKKRAFLAAIANPPRLRVTVELSPSRPTALPAGLTAFHTPGHTPGHMSLYHADSGTLVAGDIFFADGGTLRLCDPGLCSDPERNRESALSLARSLRDADLRRIVCYHGGLVERDAKRQLLAAS